MNELSLPWYVEPRGTVLRRFCGGGHIKASWKRARCTFICSIAFDAIFSSLLPAMLVGNNHQLDRSFLSTLGPPFVTALSKGFPSRVSGAVRNEDTSVACKVELECVCVASPLAGAKG